MGRNKYTEVATLETKAKRTLVLSKIEGTEDISIGQRVVAEIEGKQETIFLKNAIRLTADEAKQLIELLNKNI